MAKLIFPMLALLGGMAVAMQGQINGGLGKKIGVLEASFFSFAVGTFALLILLFFGNGNILAVASVPKWQLTGGLLGAFYVVVMITAVPHIGVSATLMSVIVGQIVLGAIIDHFGLFGGQRYPIDIKKSIAIILMLFSLYLYNKS